MRYAPAHPDQLSDLGQLIADCFNTTPESSQGWIERSGLEHWRVLAELPESTPQAALLRIPMAQWFAGKAVAMTGLAGVAVSSFARGKGVGQQLMRRTLEEMREEGTALSALYGSTTSFYRRCGYERAGSRWMAEVNLKELQFRGGPLEVRPLSESSESEVETLRAREVRQSGSLVRGPYLWNRVRRPRGKAAEGYGFYEGGILRGYTYVVREPQGFRDHVMEATDVVLTTPESVATFLGLLTGQRPFFKTARWPSPPGSALLLALTEPWQYRLQMEEHWLLRIVHLEAALSSRGYPPEVREELTLEIVDPWLAANSGPWRLSIEHGQGYVSRASSAEVCLPIGTLAPLFSGFVGARELWLTGQLQASPENLQKLERMFVAPAPELHDFF